MRSSASSVGRAQVSLVRVERVDEVGFESSGEVGLGWLW